MTFIQTFIEKITTSRRLSLKWDNSSESSEATVSPLLFQHRPTSVRSAREVPQQWKLVEAAMCVFLA